MLWATPVQVGLAIYFMFEELGRSALVGVLVIAIVVPMQGLMGKQYRCAPPGPWPLVRVHVTSLNLSMLTVTLQVCFAHTCSSSFTGGACTFLGRSLTAA
jgi:hypothetical protein